MQFCWHRCCSSISLVLLASLAWKPTCSSSPPFFSGAIARAGAKAKTPLEDTADTCDADAVQRANLYQLHPILHDLVNTTFFRLFRVNLKNPQCHFWKQSEATESSDEIDGTAGAKCSGGAGDGFAGVGAGASFLSAGGGFSDATSSFEAEPEPACGVSAETESVGDEKALAEEDKLDRSITKAELRAAAWRNNETDDAECEFEEDLPTYWVDICSGDGSKDTDYEDVNLVKNPERNTGYNGSHIWEAMYQENCFEVGSALPRGRFGDVSTSGMCYEERVLYRLLSGWQASTTLAIVKNYYAPGTKQRRVWSPNPERYMQVLGQYPERAKNLHFSFVVMLRAIKKAAAFLHSYPFSTGDEREDNMTTALMSRLLDSQVLSLCSPLFDAFDETRLFRVSSSSPAHRSTLKRQFKSVFRNITRLVDCVQCQRCRLHAKLYSTGLGTALKILMTPPNLIAYSTSRDEVVALINVLWKLSDAMEDARLLTHLYSEAHPPGTGSPIPEQPSPTLTSAASAGTATAGAHSTPLPPPSTPIRTQNIDSSVSAPVTQVVGSARVPTSPPQAAEPSGISAERRASLLDSAIGAVRQAAQVGKLSGEDEESVLRSLVVRPGPTDGMLLLAGHYAASRPDLFARLALEEAVATRRTSASLFGELGASDARDGTTPPLARMHGSAVDAVIIGGGLAGMVAAMTLVDRGASVVMVEKQPFLGGNSGKASSGINAAIETSVASLVADTSKSAGKLLRPELIARLAEDSAAAVNWLQNRTGVDLSMRSQLGGHSAERTLRPSNAFVGAELTFAAGQILNKMSAQHPDRCRLLTKTVWQGLVPGLTSGGSGWRARLLGNDSKELVIETVSVVIASGGFGHDFAEKESLMRQHRPDLADFPTTLGAHTTGDGIQIAKRDAGARLVDMDRVQLHPTGFVDPAKPNDRAKTLAAELLRGVGGLLLEKTGSRFVNELGTRQSIVDAELKAYTEGRSLPAPSPPRTFTIVLNGKAAAKADRHVTLYSKKGLLKKVQGLTGLASYLASGDGEASRRNVELMVTLNATFDAYNMAAATGHDAFGRTVFPEGHWPIESEEDFYVGQIVPVVHYTMGGIAIDSDGRALALDSKSGGPIPGLYAVGEASGGVHGDNRLAGNSLLECTVFGRHVGLSLPIASPAESVTSQVVAATPSLPSETEFVASTRQADSATPATSAEPVTASATQAASADMRKIKAEELAKHKTPDERIWVALYGKVYDLTDYIEEHPGGEDAILDVAGTDGTETFETVHNRDLLESMGFSPIGDLVA